MDDRELLYKLKKDPSEGIRLLIGSYSALVFFVLRGRLSSVCGKDELEELASDVFTDFYTSLARFDPNRGSIKAYLCRIASNVASERYSDITKRLGVVSLDADDCAEDAFESDFSVEDNVIGAELRRNLIAEVNALGEPDREIIVCKFYLGEPSKAIAEALGMTVSAVDTRTSRAIAKLRKILNQ